ncbi:MAG TPA: lipocalin family protein [Vicinamibacterales bacterium]|nr:lipocalin family protein [Vicinamibacterales bacterium]
MLTQTRHRIAALFAAVSGVLLPSVGVCADAEVPVPRVQQVDLQRYAGAWFIIGSIPLSLEKGAHNPVETYTPEEDGSIKTVFQFRKDAFDGELETKNTVATVVPQSNNAEWEVKLFWVIKGQYVISHLEQDYSAAIIARDKRDHVWILSRTPTLSDARMADYRERIIKMGYDFSKFEVFPQNGRKPQG